MTRSTPGPDPEPTGRTSPEISPEDRALLALIQTGDDRQLIQDVLAQPPEIRRSIALILRRMSGGRL